MKKLLLIIILVLSLSGSAFGAADTTTQDGNWSATATWTSGSVPGEGDTVTISHTVTIDQDITIGADTSTAAIQIASGGHLKLENPAASYILTCKGNLDVDDGGSLSFGTVANPLSSSYTFTCKLNYSASLSDQEFGLDTSGSTASIVMQGASMTYWRTTSDGAVVATDTTIDTTDTTGWSVGDKITVAASEANGETERFGIKAISGTTITLGTWADYTIADQFANAHADGVEICNLTRNVKVTAYDADYETYWYNNTADVNVDWVEFSEGGSGNWNDSKSAMPRNGSNSDVNFQYSSWYNCGNAIESWMNIGSAGDYKHNIICYNSAYGTRDSQGASNTPTWDDNSIFKNGSWGVRNIAYKGFEVFINNRVYDNSSRGVSLDSAHIDGNEIYLNGEIGLEVNYNSSYNSMAARSSSHPPQISNNYIYDNTGSGIWMAGQTGFPLKMEANNIYGNSTGITFDGITGVIDYNSNYGVTSENTSRDLYVDSNGWGTNTAIAEFIKCDFDSSTLYAIFNSNDVWQFSFDDFGKTEDDERVYEQNGQWSRDTGVTHSASPSLKATPSNTDDDMWIPLWFVVEDGDSPTITLWTYSDDITNGSATIEIDDHYHSGCTLSSTDIMPSSGSAWEKTLDGVSLGTADRNGMVRLWIRLNKGATAYNFYIDDVSINNTSVTDTTGLDYWYGGKLAPIYEASGGGEHSYGFAN
jgi:hypothetical protein